MLSTCDLRARTPLPFAGTLAIFLFLISQNVLGTEATRIVPVEMGDYRFYPDTIVVREGERVQLELTNTDGVTPHNFTLKDKPRGLDVSVDVDAEDTETIEFVAPPPGTYTFYCDKKMILMKSHRDKGMKGTLIVEPVD